MQYFLKIIFLLNPKEKKRLLLLFFLSVIMAILDIVGISSIMPFFPDLKFIITYLLRLMFYPSGVLFALSQVPEKYIDLIYLNPMTGLIEGYRRIVMYGESPNTFSMIYASSIGIVLIITGTLIIKKYEQEYPKLS